MYETPFATQRTFDRSVVRSDFVTLTVRANGGSVTVELLHGQNPDDWVQSEVFSSDGAYVIRPGSFQFRVTPAGGATYNVSRIA